MDKKRIGVYICHCGGNISDYIDVEQLASLLKSQEGVVVSKDVMFACADSNQKEMIQDIRDKNLNAIVVASCSPKLHTHTFRNVAVRAGINQYNYTQVNIREQCSWPHSDSPVKATLKAYGLIRGGINKVRYSEALQNIEIPVQRSVVVIGAGVAGMRAAIDLAKMGNYVYLVEKDFFIGGQVAEAGMLFSSETDGKELINQLFQQIRKMPQITLFTGAKIEKVSGSVGNFIIEISVLPRYISANASPERIHDAIKEYSAKYNQNKAIYKKYPEALPDIPVVDPQELLKNTDFTQKFSDVLDFQQQVQLIKVAAGSVMVATGFSHYQPSFGEFGFGSSDFIITLPEFRKQIGKTKNGQLVFKGKTIRNIAFIYCVGNRQSKGENKYCSRQCCTAAIHTSLILHNRFNKIKCFHIYRDIRTYGKHEMLYRQSSMAGDVYLKFEEKEPPLVSVADGKITIAVKDYLTVRKEITFNPDMVVLVTGMIARDDSSYIAGILKIPVGSDKFFNEIHPKLKPVETVISGVYIGGTCQGPKNIAESVSSAQTVAAKINAMMKKGTIALEPVIARINKDVCSWCGKCAEVCDYDAIKPTEFNAKQIAQVNASTCKGCGICAPVCPSDAIEIAQFTNHEIESMIDGFMEKAEIKEKEVSVFAENEQIRTGMKEYPHEWNMICKALEGKKLTIPQISEITGLQKNMVTYHLMTMNRYSVVESDGLSEDETYYLYQLKN